MHDLRLEDEARLHQIRTRVEEGMSLSHLEIAFLLRRVDELSENGTIPICEGEFEIVVRKQDVFDMKERLVEVMADCLWSKRTDDSESPEDGVFVIGIHQAFDRLFNFVGMEIQKLGEKGIRKKAKL